MASNEIFIVFANFDFNLPFSMVHEMCVELRRLASKRLRTTVIYVRTCVAKPGVRIDSSVVVGLVVGKVIKSPIISLTSQCHCALLTAIRKVFFFEERKISITTSKCSYSVPRRKKCQSDSRLVWLVSSSRLKYFTAIIDSIFYEQWFEGAFVKTVRLQET